MTAESKLIKNSSLNIAGNALKRVSRYFIAILVIRLLGVTNYGYYVLGLSIIEISSIFALFGMHYGVFRFVPIYRGEENKEKIKGVILFALKWTFIISVFISIIVYFCSSAISNHFYKKPALEVFIKILVFGLPFIAMTQVCINVIKGFNVIKYKVIIEDIVRYSSRILLLLFCMLFGLKVYGVLAVNLATNIMSFVLGLIFVFKTFPELSNSDLKPEIDERPFLMFSIPLFLTGFMNIVLNKIDILMISYFMDADKVGIYNVAHRIAVLVFFVSSSIFAVFTPTLAEFLGKGQIDRIREYYKKTTRWALLVTAPIFSLVILLSEELLSMFGSEFEVGKQPLIILAASYLINSVLGFAGQILTVSGRSKLILANSLGAGILNIILNLLLIPRYGIQGAAVATGFSIFIANVARAVEILVLEKMSAINKQLLKPILIGFTVLLIMFGVKITLLPDSSFFWSVGLSGIYLMLYVVFIWNFDLRQSEISGISNLFLRFKR